MAEHTPDMQQYSIGAWMRYINGNSDATVMDALKCSSTRRDNGFLGGVLAISRCEQQTAESLQKQWQCDSAGRYGQWQCRGNRVATQRKMREPSARRV